RHRLPRDPADDEVPHDARHPSLAAGVGATAKTSPSCGSTRRCICSHGPPPRDRTSAYAVLMQNLTLVEARRARWASQLLGGSALTPAQVVDRAVALQGQDLPAVMRAIAIRS